MRADKMFENLGYKMYEWQGYGCTYYKPKRRIHMHYEEPHGTVETENGIVNPTKAEREAIDKKIKEIKNEWKKR